MSYHMHLRAVPAEEVPQDFEGLTTFMGTAWDALAEERAAGIATAVEKDFGLIDDFYATAAGGPDTAGGAYGLIVFGGEVVRHPEEERPPFAVLSPEGTTDAAAFLDGIAFDAFWDGAGTTFRAPFARWEEADVKKIFELHHRDLRAFYRGAADRRHAVVKAFRY
ncbi:DUF1877 family protein [Streptomyces sp. t39]|uniref:DUF1877 family protein n=1 Tax=Streptomyces sp. t39 TaxID=1828156 RepID=UPI0011CEA4FB|nr:DUF1877 family protein [Streptomyces sp. t39]TXS56564.1 DUF1877 family protein [Streptomyces sp. t39]